MFLNVKLESQKEYDEESDNKSDEESKEKSDKESNNKLENKSEQNNKARVGITSTCSIIYTREKLDRILNDKAIISK